ncbi:MAG: hypothetical protein DLM57_05530 [Pseudonocardiales bacterium]|nr:MAG: hypothetical protein DLM57_05530 [Pseudonocardiales bacterium]
MTLVVTIVLLGGLWVAIAQVLAASLRRSDPAQAAPHRLAAKTAPWRAPPANRVTSMPTTRTGPPTPASDSTRG